MGVWAAVRHAAAWVCMDAGHGSPACALTAPFPSLLPTHQSQACWMRQTTREASCRPWRRSWWVGRKWGGGGKRGCSAVHCYAFRYGPVEPAGLLLPLPATPHTPVPCSQNLQAGAPAGAGPGGLGPWILVQPHQVSPSREGDVLVKWQGTRRPGMLPLACLARRALACPAAPCCPGLPATRACLPTPACPTHHLACPQAPLHFQGLPQGLLQQIQAAAAAAGGAHAAGAAGAAALWDIGQVGAADALERETPPASACAAARANA